MIYFTKQAKNLKWEPPKFLTTLNHNGTEDNGNHMEPSRKCTFIPKMTYFTKQAHNMIWEPSKFLITL